MELACWLYIQTTPNYQDRWSYRGNAKPLAYELSSFYGPDFISESRDGEASGHFNESRRILNDFSGRYINISSGIRNTTDQPSKSKGTIYVFGGSTIFSAEVPDWYTIPSYIQRRLGAQHGYKVINMGVPSMNSAQQLQKLFETRIIKNDVVIFYDGVNDVIYNAYYGYKDGLNINSEIFKKNKSFFKDELIPFFQSIHMQYLALALSRLGKSLKYKTSLSVDSLSTTTALNYKNNIQRAAKYVKDSGGIFIHFLQPNLVIQDKNMLTKNQIYLLNNYELTPPGLAEVFLETHPKLQSVSQDLLAEGVHSFDISHGLESSGREVYLDYCHINEYGNELVSDLIIKHLRQLPITLSH